jgi:hypothetical protein
MSTNTSSSADWVGSTRTMLLAWGLPHTALVAGLLVAAPAQTAIWVVALGLAAVPVGLSGWLVLGAFIILGGKTMSWATERAWGNFS